MAKSQSLESNDLEEMSSDEEFVFPPAERKVVTQPVDLSVSTLIEQWGTGHISLPPIQREYVWDNGKASRLAESLLLNIPIPVLYFSETPDATYEVIDGHQRVNSIARFVKNEFALSGLAVLREYQGMRFHQLPVREQRFLTMRTLRVIIISIDSHPSMKFEIFERLNTGAISLNAQELRNSIYRGTFNEALHQFASYDQLRLLIGTRAPRRRMVDEELVLRFLALREQLSTYRTPLKRFLNNFMATKQNFDDDALASATTTFIETISQVTAIFGNRAFRNIDASTGAPDTTINRALFDAQMLACSWVQSEPTQKQVTSVRDLLTALFSHEDFLDSIQRATGDRSRTIKRLRYVVRIIAEAGIPVNVPFDLER